jgi:soluble lytic murein transglycosylase-like protein
VKNDYDDTIREAAARFLPADYDWRLLKAQLYQESRLNPKEVSRAGAMGIAQFMPRTWAEIAPQAGYPEASPWDVVPAIMCAACYMSQLLKKWYSPRPQLDRICLALASYNGGFGNILASQVAANRAMLYAEIVKPLGDITGQLNAGETRGYVANILEFYADQVIGRKSKG